MLTVILLIGLVLLGVLIVVTAKALDSWRARKNPDSPLRKSEYDPEAFSIERRKYWNSTGTDSTY